MESKEQILKLENENAKLKEQLEHLKNDVQHYRIRSALLDKTNLPKAKSVACYNCKYAAFVRYGKSGLCFLGCRRSLAKGGCNDYEHTDYNKVDLDEMWDYLVRLGKDYYPSQVLSQTCEREQLQKPPCHEQ